jgi:hypothetical protein
MKVKNVIKILLDNYDIEEEFDWIFILWEDKQYYFDENKKTIGKKY